VPSQEKPATTLVGRGAEIAPMRSMVTFARGRVIGVVEVAAIRRTRHV
jgi:hypothetical protein